MTARGAKADRARRVERPRITVLVDNRRAGDGLAREHGLSLWLEAGPSRVLIDTGETAAFSDNARALGIDLAEADAIVLSHGHYDHTGGLPQALASAPAARLCVHPAALQPRYLRRKRGRPESIGMRGDGRAAALAAAGRIVWTDRPTEVVPGVWCTGPVPRDPEREPGDPDFFHDAACTMPDVVADDQSLWLDSADGLWVILGCAHAGVLATLEYIDELTAGRPLAVLIGGTHLMAADEARVALVCEDLARRTPAVLAPCHCTGQSAAAALRRAQPESMRRMGSGAVIE